MDHIVRWPTGTTSDVDLSALCRRDHRLKHEAGWRHEIISDPTQAPGTVKIVSAAGQVFCSYPFAYPTGVDRQRTETLDPTKPYARLDVEGEDGMAN